MLHMSVVGVEGSSMSLISKVCFAQQHGVPSTTTVCLLRSDLVRKQCSSLAKPSVCLSVLRRSFIRVWRGEP